MRQVESLCHARWECKYHVVFIPKYRKKTIYGALRRRLRDVFRTLAEQKESPIEEGHLMPDHVHMMISIPPKYSVAMVVGCPSRSHSSSAKCGANGARSLATTPTWPRSWRWR